MYRTLGLADLGSSLSCQRDFALVQGFNPAIELTRTAAEHTEHAEREGRDWKHETLPDTVHEALQAQLDQLAPREKQVLQAAAVAGRTFRAATLQSLVDTGALSPKARTAPTPSAMS